MSRGLGRLQRSLMMTIRRQRKPMTFEDIRAVIRQDNDLEAGTELQRSFERSLRRALQHLARDGLLIVIGGGGPGDPFRYFFHPLSIGMMGERGLPEQRALEEAIQAEVERHGEKARVQF